jgi:hypothetical protein
MLNCSISSCRESYSEILGLPRIREKWFVATADEWPQLARLAKSDDLPCEIANASGVEKIVLCPKHRKEVFNEILEMRKLQNV